MAERRTFYPALLDARVHTVASLTALPYLRAYTLRLTETDFPDADAERLRRACAAPGLVCANHPSLHEPVVLFDVLHRVGVRGYYVSARSTMEQAGWLAPWMQRLGVFSIRRGTADREAFSQTRQLLRAGGQIVTFPEGETYGLNDLLLPFHEGPVQFGFWGVQERREAGLSPACLLVPIAIKYRYVQDMRGQIDLALGRLEERLGIEANPRVARYERVRRVGDVLTAQLCREYYVPVPDGAEMSQRIEALYTHLLERASLSLDCSFNGETTLQDKLRRLFSVLHQRLWESQRQTGSPYERDLRQRQRRKWLAFKQDLAMLQNFQAVSDGYIAEYPSAERYLDVIERLERAVLGQSRLHGPRAVAVRVGEPIDLAERWDDYKADRKQAVAAARDTLRRRIWALLEPLTQAVPTLED